MNIKDRIYQIVSDNSLSVEEKYAKIQELLRGRGKGAGSTSGGTGEGAGGGTQNGSSGGSKSGEGEDSEGSGEGKDEKDGNQNGQGQGQGQDGEKGSQDGQGQGQGDGKDSDGKDGKGQGSGESGEDGEGEDGEGSGSGKDGQNNQNQKQNGKGGGQGEDSENGEGEDGEGSGQGGKSGNQNQQNQKGKSGGNGDSEDGDGEESDSDSDGQGNGQGKNGQNQNQNSQNQQNQNGQNQNQQKQDPEDRLKDLDLGKKQVYKQAKGDGTDDPIVNGLPPGEVEDDDDDDNQGGFGGQMPEEFDDYLAGKYIGIAYAKEVFKGHGVKPTYGYVYDIPDVDPMTLIESLLTESDSDPDIRDILSGGGDAGSQAEAIYKLLFPDTEATNAPEDLIMMRNGDVSLEDWGNDDHVISKELGDEIKKEIEEMPNSVDQDIKEIDPEWGSTGSDGEVQERMKYIKKLLDPNYIQDKFKREAAKKYVEKFGARIEKNSEGIVDWKKSLEDFIDNVSSHKEDGRMKKNVYHFSGIISHRKKRVYDQIGKLVIYADTSASAYSFCSTMISEVSKMARDCNIGLFDIHLFTDVVYGEHWDIDGETVESDDFGFEDVQSGGTSLDNVYNHIIDNYIEDGELIEGVSGIIIMTDVSGVEESGRIDNTEYFKGVLERMMYLLFDPAEIPQRSLAKLLTKGCRFMAITPTMLRASRTPVPEYESISYRKGYSVLEAIGKNIDSVKDKLYNTETDEEKRRAYMKRQNVGAMRDLGRLDQLVPEVFSAIEKNIPGLESVKNVEYFEDTDNTFYIDDDLRVWIHKDFTDSNSLTSLINLCAETKIFKILGNVSIIGNYGFTELPNGFPEIIEGKFVMNKLPRLESFVNVPKRMSEYYINIHDSRRHFGELLKQAEELGLDVEVQVDPLNSRKGVFKQYTNESMKMNEAVGKSLGAVKQKLNKAADADDEQKKEYMRKTNIRAMRDLGRLDQLVPDIFAAMREILPEISVVQNVDYFEDTENTFYIDDDLRLWIHKDFSSREDARRLLDLCKKTDVFMVIGSVVLQNMPAFTGFPAGFPKEIKGLFKLNMLINLRSLDNAPKVIYGEVMPSINPMSRWIRKSDVDSYIESITDKKNNSVNVFNLLRLGKNNETNESMNNTVKESEIAKRFAMGQKYLNEAFPKSMGDLFRSPIPQEIKLPKEPSRDDFDSDKEYERAQKKYDAIKAKKERRESKFQADMEEYNEKLRPLYRRNAEIFHEVITPLIDADWGSIKDSDVVRLDDFKKIHTDLIENRKSFQGVKIFADDNREISLVYAKTIDDKTPRVVYFRDENGDGVTDPATIRQDILRRDAIYKKVDEYFVNKLNFKWDDLPSIKEDYPTVEEVFLNILFWSLANINGTDTSERKQFKVDEVLYNERGLDKKDLFTEYVRTVFNGLVRPKYNSDVAYIVDRFGTANFEATPSNGPRRALMFIELVRKSNENNPSFNPAVYFTDDAIRAVLLGLVVRAEYDGKKKYTTDEIINADRDELINMAYDVLDFNIYRSSLKYMTYSGKRIDISSNASVENPQCVLLLFPDVCRTEYIVNIEVNESVLNNYEKRALRKVNRAGMTSTIKDYDYDYRTGQRTRSDITGNKKSINVEATTLDQFEQYAKYFKEAKFDEINKVARKGIEEYNDQYKYSNEGKLYKTYVGAVADIKGYPDLIISEIKSNPEKENANELELLIDLYVDIQDSFEEMYNLKNNIGYGSEVVRVAKRILRQADKIRRMYSVISGVQDARRTNALSKIISRAERRGNTTLGNKEVEVKEYDMTPFVSAVDAAATDYQSVKRILNAVDFANADEDAIDEFGSKDELIRRVTKNVDSALGFARAVASANDSEKAEGLMSDIKELGEILSSIVAFNDDMDNPDNAVTKTAIELEDLSRKLAKEAKRYAGSSAAQAGYTA